MHFARQSNGIQFTGIVFLFLVFSIIFMSFWIVLNWMKDVKRFPLSELIITGECRYTHNIDIRQSIVSLRNLDAFITQDIVVIHNQIKHLPWIKKVSVRKQWPNKLKIHLVEYVPIAFWNSHSMIDIDGNSFTIPVADIRKQSLPMLYGPEGREKEVLRGFQEINKILENNKFMLKEAFMTIHRSWKLTLTNNIKLNLGHNNVMKHLIHFVEIYPILLKEMQIIGKRINYIDLRYDSGAAVCWTLVEPFEQSIQ